MQLKVVPLEKEHIESIVLRNESCGIFLPSPITISVLADAYLSPGSRAGCILVDDKPIAIAGIMNLMWHRGEAWLMIANDSKKHFRPIIRLVKEFLPNYATSLGLHRVQATSFWNESKKLLTIFGFESEGTLRAYGPQGEHAVMYARIFND